MKILHTADWQLGAQRKLPGSLDRQAEALDELIEIAQRENVVAILVAGDIFEHSQPQQREKDMLFSAIHKMDKLAFPVVIMPGNHDYEDRALSGYHTLKALKILESRFPHLTVVDGETMKEFERFLLYAIPPLSDRSKPIVLPPTDSTKPRILMLHETFQGAGYRGMPTDKGLDPKMLDQLDVDYVALGDIHKRQRLKCDVEAWYCGSLIQKDFGEDAEDCGVNVVNITSKGVSVTPVCLKRPYALMAAQVQMDEISGAIRSAPQHTILRLTVDATAQALRELDTDALYKQAEKRDIKLLLDKRLADIAQPAAVEGIDIHLARSNVEELKTFLASHNTWGLPADKIQEVCVDILSEVRA